MSQPNLKKPIRKAVFPVAGLGTRFLPATKAMPKEMLTLVDRPLIQHAVDEARAAGIEQFIFVTSRGKGALEARKKTQALELLQTTEIESGQILITRQREPLGLGHAVWCARHLVGNEPFAVLLADDLMVGKPGALTQMIEAYNAGGGGGLVAAEGKPREELNRYGVFKTGAENGNAVEVRGMVEKPKPADAPSRLTAIGRYVLQPEVFAELDRREKGAGGEIQLTDSLARLIGRMPFPAVRTTCARYDCGDKIGFLQANLAVGLQRKDIAPHLRATLKKLTP